MKLQKIASLALLVSGLASFAWLLYDASAVQRVLGLERVTSEAAVAIAGLVVSSAALIAGALVWRDLSRKRRERPAV